MIRIWLLHGILIWNATGADAETEPFPGLRIFPSSSQDTECREFLPRHVTILNRAILIDPPKEDGRQALHLVIDLFPLTSEDSDAKLKQAIKDGHLCPKRVTGVDWEAMVDPNLVQSIHVSGTKSLTRAEGKVFVNLWLTELGAGLLQDLLNTGGNWSPLLKLRFIWHFPAPSHRLVTRFALDPTVLYRTWSKMFGAEYEATFDEHLAFTRFITTCDSLSQCGLQRKDPGTVLPTNWHEAIADELLFRFLEISTPSDADVGTARYRFQKGTRPPRQMDLEVRFGKDGGSRVDTTDLWLSGGGRQVN